VYALNPNIKLKNGFITYIKHIYDVTTLNKHVDCEHAIIVNFFEKEVNKGPFAKQPTKNKCFRKCNIYFSLLN
jgi:hypothetical protein